jgi:hypothetical protein
VGERNKVRLRFHFTPKKFDGTNPFLFRPVLVDDLDGNGRVEIVGAWEIVYMLPEFPVPVVVVWNDAEGRYEIHAVSQRPRLVRSRGLWARTVRERYVRVTLLENEVDGSEVRGWATQDFTVDKSASGGVVLVAGYPVVQAIHAGPPKRVQLVAWSLDLLSARPSIFECAPYGLGASSLFLSPGAFSYPRALTRRWHQVRHRVYC